MNLTGRQRDFLGQFVDLYQEMHGLQHYTIVAQHLGVSKITAYDMLRLLEERGLARSEYVLRGKGKGAGRSRIVFQPTQAAHDLVAELAGGASELREWETAKERILQGLLAAADHDYQDLLADILARIESHRSPVLYAAEMIAATIISLQQLRQDAISEAGPLEKLGALRIPNEAILSALGGVAVGLSFVERLNRKLVHRLISYEGRYQEIVANLSAENRDRLVSFAKEVMHTVDT